MANRLAGYTDKFVQLRYTNTLYVISFIMHCYISAHYTIQKMQLDGTNVWILSFWYSIFGTIVSLIPSVLFEKMTLPSTGVEWAFMIGHCFGSALFAAATMVGQQMASPMTVSLALGFQIVFYFAAQYIFFYECCTALGLMTELVKAALAVLSAVLVPLQRAFVHLKGRRLENDFNPEKTELLDSP